MDEVTATGGRETVTQTEQEAVRRSEQGRVVPQPSQGTVPDHLSLRKVRFLKVTPKRPEPTETLKLHQNLDRKASKHPGQSVIQSNQQKPIRV
ncbi:hypothetical protein T265_00510 [Opisthorchis viverrini]|uniref:Uncharacterized protein n=1 Tax=Opisthorchis viverrini TaxID=6198 RepID=A0A075AJM0_OPIVI|nr:hypothetical protein T265_00510 [Opisthorchis viverrini]KER33619.1 hypothetical protein T265_00510 [Opisthorchis viverrini]